MLHDAIVLPAALSPNGNSCPPGFRLLQDLVTNCTVRVDPGEAVAKAYSLEVRSWPPQFRKAGEVLLQKLHTRGRLVPVSKPYVPSTACRVDACQHCLGISALGKMPVLASNDCVRCASQQSSHTIDLSVYPVSVFGQLRAVTGHFASHGQWTTHEAESRIFAPLFSSVTHVKLIDRYIGRNVVRRTRNGVKIGPFGANYARSLEWIFRLFLKHAPDPKNSIFEIYCGIDATHLTAKELAAAVAVIRTHESTIGSALGHPFRFLVKKEAAGATMPHARAIVTDQLGVQVDRGFDLLMDPKEMTAAGWNPAVDPPRLRDAVFTLCDDSGKIESAARILPNA